MFTDLLGQRFAEVLRRLAFTVYCNCNKGDGAPNVYLCSVFTVYVLSDNALDRLKNYGNDFRNIRNERR